MGSGLSGGVSLQIHAGGARTWGVEQKDLGAGLGEKKIPTRESKAVEKYDPRNR